MSRRSPVVDALRLLTPKSSAKGGAFLPWVVWDYEADFNELWNLESIEPGHAIVVWQRTPDDPSAHPVVTEPYVTPFDWAIVACSRQERLRVTVFDLRDRQRDQEDHAALRPGSDPSQLATVAGYPTLRWLRTQRPESVPWLRRLRVSDLVEAADSQSLSALLAWDVGTPSREAVAPLVSPRETLRGLPVCRVDLGSHASHHSIANLVGPLLLLRKAHQAGHQEALRQMLVSAGRAPANPVAAEPDTSVASTLQMLKPIRLVLLDDQWHHGWAEWIAHLLGLAWDETAATSLSALASPGPRQVAGTADSGVTLWVARDPNWLSNCIKSSLGRDNKPDARFRLRLTDGATNVGEILLLDLRLFPSEGAEKAFVGGLVGVARRFVSAGAWPVLEEAELKRLEAWAAGRGEYDRAAALTLLPRLVAHVDFSLPIVLFSSTGLRAIVEKLKGYESIDTQFAKPRMLGDAATEVEEATTTFVAALQSAGRVAAARELCRRVLREAEKGEAARRRVPTDIGHFELYLDESGSSAVAGDPDAKAPEGHRFVIGGLLVGYRSALDEHDGPPGLHGRMETAGLRWWPANLGSPYLVKRSRIRDNDLPGGEVRNPDEILGTFLGCLQRQPAYGICVEYRDVAALDEGDELRAQWRGDNRHRLVLSTLLEILLFEILPTVVSSADTTLSIFVAGRARDATEFRGGRATVQRIRELYGYEGSPTHFRSLSEASVLPIILEVLERRGGARSSVRLEHARGVWLAYPELERGEGAAGPPRVRHQRPQWDMTRHQHYVADVVTNLCWRTGAKFPWQSNISRLFQDGTYDVIDARLGALLRAARALETQDRPGALQELANIDFQRSFAKRSGAMLVLQRLAKAVREDLTGEDLVVLSRTLDPDDLDQRATSATPERGSVTYFNHGEGFGFITPERGGVDVRFRLPAWRNATYPTIGEIVEFGRSSVNPEVRPKASWVHALA